MATVLETPHVAQPDPAPAQASPSPSPAEARNGDLYRGDRVALLLWIVSAAILSVILLRDLVVALLVR